MDNLKVKYRIENEALFSRQFEDRTALNYRYAVELAKKNKKVSISEIQILLNGGYNHACTIANKLIENKVITEPGPDGTRESLVYEG